MGCGQCGGAAFDIPNTAMDGVVSAARVVCSHDGCEMYVPYHQVPEHRSACPHAPCHCAEAGCGFTGPAPALVAHLADDHDMPVNRVPYGKVHRIQVPVPEPARRLLVGAGDEGGAFLLTLAPLGSATVVSAVCVRAEACLWPRYTVKMWANGPPLATPAANRKTDIVLADFEAKSSTTPGAVEFEELTSYLTVPRRYLVGDGPSKELPLHVRIERTASS
jgi:E3 ubiquitin-protein ligase SIAH1